MTIEKLIRDRIRNGRAGSKGSWRLEKGESDPFAGPEWELWHYSTLMLRWTDHFGGGVTIRYTSTGHGSVSDQGGMNTAFKALGVPYRFDRAGGAQITDISEQLPEGHYMLRGA